MYQVTPFGIIVGALFEVETQAIAKLVVSEHVGKLLQHAWRFGINNRAVGGLCVFEVRNVLVDGRRALGHINAISSRLDGLVKALPDVLLWF